MSEALTLPEGWAKIRLSDAGVFQGGSGFPLIAQGKSSGKYPFFKVSDFSNNGNERTLNRANHYVDDEDKRRIGARLFPAGTIAFAKIGAAIFLERKRLLDQDSCLDNNMAGYILHDPDVSRDLVLANLLQFSLGGLVASTALPAIGSGELKSISFPMPTSRHEQQAIAAALSDADGVVAGLERVIAKKRLIKQGAMQDLLTARRRLPGVSGEWDVASLGSLLRRSPSYGINAAAMPRGAGGFAYLRITDIADDGTVDPSGLPSVRESASDDYLLSAGDIVVARTGASVGKSHQFRDIGEPVIFAGFLIRLSPDETKILPSFLSQYMQTQKYWDWVRENSARSGQPGVNGQQLRTIMLKLPRIEEQQAIAAVLSDMDAEIQTLESRLTKARAVKEGMMQNLLTGRVRLV